MRSSPLWPVRVAAAHTVPRECRAEESWVYEPGQFDGIRTPTLLLAGSESVPALTKATRQAAAAIAGAQVRALDRHGHVAHKTDPALMTEIVLASSHHRRIGPRRWLDGEAVRTSRDRWL